MDSRETRLASGRLTVSLVQGCVTNMNYVMTDKYASVIISHTIDFLCATLHSFCIMINAIRIKLFHTWGELYIFLINTYFLRYVADRFQRNLPAFLFQKGGVIWVRENKETRHHL